MTEEKKKFGQEEISKWIREIDRILDKSTDKSITYKNIDINNIQFDPFVDQTSKDTGDGKQVNYKRANIGYNYGSSKGKFKFSLPAFDGSVSGLFNTIDLKFDNTQNQLAFEEVISQILTKAKEHVLNSMSSLRKQMKREEINYLFKSPIIENSSGEKHTYLKTFKYTTKYGEYKTEFYNVKKGVYPVEILKNKAIITVPKIIVESIFINASYTQISLILKAEESIIYHVRDRELKGSLKSTLGAFEDEMDPDMLKLFQENYNEVQEAGVILGGITDEKKMENDLITESMKNVTSAVGSSGTTISFLKRET